MRGRYYIFIASCHDKFSILTRLRPIEFLTLTPKRGWLYELFFTTRIGNQMGILEHIYYQLIRLEQALFLTRSMEFPGKPFDLEIKLGVN